MDALPGWTDDRVAGRVARVSRRMRGARRIAAATTRALAARRAPLRNASTRSTQPPSARFFESHFSPYQVAAADGRDAGMVTGYYEPLLTGSRATHPRASRCRCTRAPDDLLTVDLDGALSRS